MKYIQWDGASPEKLSGQLKGINGIVNLAGESLSGSWWTKKYKERIISSRTGVGQAVAAAVKMTEYRPQFLLQGSATGFYGSRKYELMDETAGPGSGFLSDLTKQWEESVHEVEQLGVRLVYLRTGLVFSRTRGIFPLLTMPFRFGARVTPGSGSQWLSWIHLKDQMSALRFLAEREDCSGPYNLVSPQPVTMKNLMRMISFYKTRLINIRIPDSVMKLALGEMAEETILANQKVAPARLLEKGFVFNYGNPNEALDDILR